MILKRTTHNFLILLTVFSLLAACNEPPKAPAVESESTFQHFRLTSPNITGVDFTNKLTEGLNTNILMYEYFYNGGGVAVGDVNGDGNLDIYFTSNMEENKLYVNTAKGKLKYQEVSKQAGVTGRPGPWKTGASMADINGDGKLDIYLCYSGALPEEKRKNQLFINQGNDEKGVPQFKEMAASYGLASEAFSNQAYYFDYDKDNDLDILLLNHNPRNLPILNEVQTEELFKKDDPQRGVRLFQQDNGSFQDVTQKAGIVSSELTYGLGLGISDLNNDGWPDFYVSNDYAVPDYLYINNQDGTFTNSLETSMGHSSQFSMGNDVADINNDGQKDIITLDMLPEDNRRQKLLLAPDNYNKFDHNVNCGFYYQYMRNMLQLNNGNNTYSEVGQLAGISNTDWSWAALAADYDNDGWKDLYITNGYHRDYTNLDFINYMDSYVEKKGRLKRTDVLEIIQNMPASDLPNYMYQGTDSLRFVDRSYEWGLPQIANSNGAGYADLDNDGDLDLIVNNINQKAFIYENLSADYTENSFLQVELVGEGQNTQALGSQVTVYQNGKPQVLEQYPVRGYLSSVSPVLHFGLNKTEVIDSVLVEWSGGGSTMQYNVLANTRIRLFEKDASERNQITDPYTDQIFQSIEASVQYANQPWDGRDFDRQSLLISEMSFTGPCMTKADVNGDGLMDLFIGGEAGQAAGIFLQRPEGSFSKASINVFESDKASVDTKAVFLDANDDSYPDLYVTSGGYHLFGQDDPVLQDRLYLNDGKGGFTKAAESLPKMPTSTSCVVPIDVNDDGSLDLFVGGRVIPGRYPERPASYLLANDGQGNFSKLGSSEVDQLGMVTDAIKADLDGDQVPELIVVGEWMPLKIFTTKDQVLTNVTDKYLDQEYMGFWNVIHIADLNQDGRPDLVAGNIGTNVQFKVSNEEPAELYYNDFDNNGSVDPIFCYYIEGVSYPYVTRDELLRQMVSFKSQYTSYESFADVTISDLFSQEQLNNAGRLEINELKSCVFMSSEAGMLKKIDLPKEAQFSPVYTINSFDYNGDGQMDLLLCGNNSHLKLRLGKADANYGMLFKGKGNGLFEYVSQTSSGLKLRGDVRSVEQIGDTFFFGINQQSLESYRLGRNNVLP